MRILKHLMKGTGKRLSSFKTEDSHAHTHTHTHTHTHSFNAKQKVGVASLLKQPMQTLKRLRLIFGFHWVGHRAE